MHPELERLIRAYDAAQETRGAEAEQLRGTFETLLEEALAQQPGLGRESLLNLVRLQHGGWLLFFLSSSASPFLALER
jgi:hypothetical protein